jgi:hypothetical protein
VVFYQPHHKFCVALVEAMSLAKAMSVNSPKFGVVSSAAFAYVVVQRGNVQQNWLS